MPANDFITRAGFTSEGVFTPDNLIAGDFPIRTEKVVLISGQNVIRGTVLGVITASGKYNKSLSAAGDGSQNVFAIAAESVDASAGDKELVVYLSGDFNEDQLTFGTGHTAASTFAALRNLSIFLHKPVNA